MKKQLLFIALMVITISQMYAQAGTTIGAHLSYGTKDLNLGFGARGEFGVADKISISPKFTYHTGRSEGGASVTGWNLDGDVHYYFTNEGISFYGIAGLTYASSTVKVGQFGGGSQSFSDSKIGINLGAGANFSSGGNLIPFAEIKYNSPFEAILISAGVKFGVGGK